MPEISIVIPIYNIGSCLSHAVESALGQSLADIEVIPVDDGSADGSGALCDQYALEDPRILVIHQRNGGLSSARNTGVKASCGERLLLLDGDDHLRSDAAERSLSAAESSGADLVQFQYAETDSYSVPAIRDVDGVVSCADSPAELFSRLYELGGVGASGCTKLYKRELLLSVPFEPVRHEDEMWCTRAFPKAPRVAYINDVLYFYVMRDNSIIRSRFDPQKLDIFRVIRERLAALDKLDLPDLAAREYSKLFSSILWLYKEAKSTGDAESCRFIRGVFEENRQAIRSRGSVSGKFGVMLRLMSIRFEFIRLYCAYYNNKAKR